MDSPAKPGNDIRRLPAFFAMFLRSQSVSATRRQDLTLISGFTNYNHSAKPYLSQMR